MTARKTSNLIVRKSVLAEARALLADAGFVPLKEEDASETAVRLYFAAGSDEDTTRLFRAIPREMHASFATPEELQALMKTLADKARSQT
jgi:hypothetical protein